MTQIKLFRQALYSLLETHTNEWLEKNKKIEVIDIKYQITKEGLNTAMIIYKK